MAVQRQRSVPDTMRAVVLEGPGNWSLDTISTPDLDEVENVLCKVRAAAICGSDPKMMEGELPWPSHFPFVPGHEWAGEVVAVGDGVDRFEPGDRIFSETHAGCGFCRMCRRGKYNLCENFGDFETGHRQIGHTMDGAFAEYVAVPESLLYHLDDAITWPEAALLDVSAIALHCAERGNVEPGDSVAVIGTGIIGLCMVQQVRAMGASEIIAVGNPLNNELAAELGTHHTISYRTDDVVKEILQHTGGRGVDVALEAVGIEQTFRQAVEVVRKGGTVSLDGMPTERLHSIPVADIVKNEIDVRGCRAHSNKAEASAELVKTGQVDLTPLVSHEFPLAEFERAYETFTGGEEQAIRVVVRNE